MTANIKTLVDAFVTQVNDQDYNIAEDINALQEALDAIAYANIGQASFANTETLSGTKTLTDDSPALQFLNPNAADKDVSLPAVAATNHAFVIMNTNGGNYVLNVKNAGGTVIRIVPSGKSFTFISDGTQWVVVGFDLYKTISPAQITASQNNYNPTGAYEADIMRLDSDAAYNITGLAGGSAGRIKVIRNIGAFTLTFKNEDASSTAANRFDFGADFELETKKTMLLIYDPTSARWGMIGGGGGAAATPKGFGTILSSSVPLTLGAPVGFIDSASSPVDSFPYFEFADAALAYVDLYCRMVNYGGGGLTINFEVLRTSAAAAATYYFQAAIRRINTGTEDITASHTYDYNSVVVTIPAGPPAAGIPMAGVITFTDGADMDSLANNEMFVLRFRRDPTHASDNAGDAARVLSTVSIRET